MMIRRAVLISLALIVIYSGWDFYKKAVAYHPVNESPGVANSSEGSFTMKETFHHAWGQEIVSRNLFKENRGYDPKPVIQNVPDPSLINMTPVPVPEPIPMPAVKLNGIIKNHNGELTAYIQLGETPSVGVRSGDKIDELEIVEVRDRRVLISWRGQKSELVLTNRSILKR